MSEAKKMAKHSAIYAIGNISRQLVGFIMLPIYTRFLTPADYGVIGLLTFTISLIELVFGARLIQAVPKFYYQQNSKSEKYAVVATALLITSLISTATMLLVVYFKEETSRLLFGDSEYGLVTGIFAVLILTHALENYALQFIRIRQKPWLFIGINIAKLLVQLTLNITLVVFAEMGVLGVAISSASSSIVFAIILLIYTTCHTGIKFEKTLAKKMVIYCWPLWIAAFAGLYIGSSNRYFIRLFSSLDDIGLYELAAKFSAIIGLLVWQPFMQYWQTERFSLYRRKDPIPIYQGTYRIACAGLAIAALGISLFAPTVIGIMAADSFHQASEAIPFLAYGTVFGCLVNFCNFSFLVTEKTGWLSRNNYITAAIVTVFYLILIPGYGFVGAAAGLMLAQAVQLMLVYHAAKKEYDMQLDSRPLIAYLGTGAALIICHRLLLTDNIWMNLAVASLLLMPMIILAAIYNQKSAILQGIIHKLYRRQKN